MVARALQPSRTQAQLRVVQAAKLSRHRLELRVQSWRVRVTAARVGRAKLRLRRLETARLCRRKLVMAVMVVMPDRCHPSRVVKRVEAVMKRRPVLVVLVVKAAMNRPSKLARLEMKAHKPAPKVRKPAMKPRSPSKVARVAKADGRSSLVALSACDHR